MDEAKSHGTRIIRLSRAAEYDLSGIDIATATTWGEVQAERYLGFVRETFAILAHDPKMGKLIGRRRHYRVYIAKFRKSRTSHGHRIFYREIKGGIRIIRVLHTAMYWPAHIK